MSDVQVVAVACRTPVGLRAEGTSAAIRAQISRLREHPIFVDAWGEPVVCGRDPLLPPALGATERVLEMTRAALGELAGKLEGLPLGNLPFYLALPERRPGFGDVDLQRVAGSLTRQLGAFTVEPSCFAEGHAGFFTCLARGLEQIRSGRAPLCIVGGADSYLEGTTLDWLEEERLLRCRAARGGFPPGEGAALVVLASSRFVRQHRLDALASVPALACALDKRDPYSAESLQGEGLTQVFEQLAARRANLRFDDSYCDVNDERTRTTDLAFALLRAGALFRDGTSYVTPVACTGDLGAATGALNVALAVRAWARGYAHGENAVVYGASWGGSRGALLLEKPGS